MASVKCPRCKRGVEEAALSVPVYFERMRPAGSVMEPDRYGYSEERQLFKREEVCMSVCSSCLVEVKAWASGQSKAKPIYTTSSRMSMTTAKLVLNNWRKSGQGQAKPRCKHGTAGHLHCYACDYGL